MKMSKQCCQVKCLDGRLSAAVEREARFQGQNRFGISLLYLPDVRSSPSFRLFLLDSDVLGRLSRLTSTRQSNQRERGIKGRNTFDRLARDEPWGHSETAFDTEAYIFGVQPTSRYSHKSFGARRPRETDVFTSREEKKMPKKLTTSATERDNISLLRLGYTWPRGSEVKGFLERKK